MQFNHWCSFVYTVCTVLFTWSYSDSFLLYFFIKYWLWLLYFFKINLYKCLCHFDNIYNIKLYLHLYKQRYCCIVIYIIYHCSRNLLFKNVSVNMSKIKIFITSQKLPHVMIKAFLMVSDGRKELLCFFTVLLVQHHLQMLCSFVLCLVLHKGS